jgi:four helix bundle protein
MGADPEEGSRGSQVPPPGMFLFETLDVYQKALDLAERAARLASRFGRGQWHLADQLNRASLSVALNIAEGNGRGGGLDKRRFLLISRGSVHECVAVLEVCKRLDLVQSAEHTELRRELHSLARMLSTMIRNSSVPTSVGEDTEEYRA